MVLVWLMIAILPISIAALISALTRRRRSLSDYGSVDGSAFISIIYTFLILEQCILEIERDREIPYMKIILCTNLRGFLFFTIWCGVTTFWSVNASLTGFRTVECLAYFLLVVIIVARLVFRHGISVMLGWFIRWYVVAYIVLQVARRAVDGGDMYDLITAAQMLAPVFFYTALFNENSRYIKVIVAAFSFFSHSTTGYIGLALGSLGLWFGESRKKSLALLLLVLIALGSIFLGPQHLLRDTVFRKREINLESSSGRDNVWKYAWICGKQRPFTGYGFFVAEPYILYDAGLTAINCHNSIMSAFLGTGVLGVFLIALYILSYIPILCSQTIPTAYRSALIGGCAVAFVQCMGNPGIGSRVYGSWMPVTIMFVMISVIDFKHRNNLPIAGEE